MILRAEIIADLLEASAEEEKDPFVITPEPDLEALRKSGSASIDLRLGTWFLKLQKSRQAFLEPLIEEEHRTTQLYYVPFGEAFVLHPQTFVLGVTLEWVRLPSDLAAYVTGRSSWGRRGLIIATAIGVHPGFTGCLTLELSNVGEMPIPIKPGMEMCQLFLHRTEGDSKSVDRTSFVGLRKPVLGTVKMDELAKKLGGAAIP